MRRALMNAVLVSACFVDEPATEPDPDGSTGATTSTPSTSATETATTSTITSETSGPPDESSSGDIPATCGNGIVEGDEPCDDGDDLAGDGCNPDCRPSGSVIWAVQLEDLMPDTDHTFNDVVVDGEQVIAVGQLGLEDADVGHPFSIVVDANDGAQIYFQLEDTGWEFWNSVAVAPDRSWIAVAGWRDPPAETFQGVAVSFPIEFGLANRHDVLGAPDGRDELTTVIMRPDGVALYGGGMWSDLDPLTVTRSHLEARDVDGNVLWARDGFGLGNTVTEIALADDGSIFVIGAITPMSGNVVGWAAKLNVDGMTMQWERTFPAADGHEFLLGLALDSNGDALVASTLFADDSTLELRKLSALDGHESWLVAYDGLPGGTDGAFDVAVDGTDASIVAGFSQRAGEDENIWVAKYDTNGLEMWTFVEDGPAHGSDTATAVITDEANNIYIAGRSAVDGLRRARLLKLAP